MVIRLQRTTQSPAPSGRPVSGGNRIVLGQPINAAAPSARLGQTISSAASAIYQQQRDQEIVARVSELDIARRRADAEVINGFASLRGKAAVEKRAEVIGALERNSTGLRSGVRDTAVANAWAQQDAKLTEAAMQQIDAHYRRENLAWQVDTQVARQGVLEDDFGRVALAGGLDGATGQFSQEGERARSSLHDSIRVQGELQGWSSERMELERRQADTRSIGGVVSGLMRAERYEDAVRVLEKHGDAIDSDVRAQLQQQATKGARLADVAKRSDEAADLLMQRSGTYLEQLQGLDAMRQELGDEVYERTADRLRAANADRQERTALAQNEVRQQAEQWLFQNPNRSLRDNPQLFLAAEELDLLPQLDRFARDRERVTDPGFVKVLEETPLADLGRMSDAQLDSYLASGLAPGDAKEWKSLIRGDQSTLSVSRRVRAAARDIGLISPIEEGQTLRPEERRALDQFERYVDELVQSKRDDKNRDLNEIEIQKEILDPLVKSRLLYKGTDVPEYRALVDETGKKQMLGPDLAVNVPDATGRMQAVRLIDIPRDRVVDILRKRPGLSAAEVAEVWLGMPEEMRAAKPEPRKPTQAEQAEAARLLLNWPTFSPPQPEGDGLQDFYRRGPMTPTQLQDYMRQRTQNPVGFPRLDRR